MVNSELAHRITLSERLACLDGDPSQAHLKFYVQRLLPFGDIVAMLRLIDRPPAEDLGPAAVRVRHEKADALEFCPLARRCTGMDGFGLVF